MPLPWLIGAAVVGIGAAIAAAVKDDDKPSSKSSSSDDAEQRRRREAAEQERKKRERDEKLAAARALFQERGEQHRAGLRKALDEVACVIGDEFKPRLTAKGVVFDKRIDEESNPLAIALRNAFPDQHDDVEATIGNLDFYTGAYHRAFPLTPTTRLSQELSGASDITSQLEQLEKARTRLLGLKQELAKTA